MSAAERVRERAERIAPSGTHSNVARALARDSLELLAENERLVAERDTALRALREIADPSYVGNYSPEEVMEIYRKWAAAALASLGTPEEQQ